MRSIGSPFVDKGRLRDFLKDPLLIELLNSSKQPAKNNDKVAKRIL
jgi:hypothetical protein